MAREAPLLPVAKRYLAGMATTFACLVAHIALTPSLAAGDGAQSQSLSRHSFLACMPLVLAAVAAIIVIAYRAAMKFDRAFKLQDLANPVRGLLAPFKRADSDLEAALRREQANHIGTQLNVLMAINIANLCLVTAMIWQSVDTTLLAVWFAVVLLMAVMGIAARMKARGRADFMTSPVSKRTLRRITLHSGFRGVMWGLCFSLFFASVGPAGQLILLSVSLGMLAGGIPALAPVPSAALLFGLGIVLPTVLRLVAMGGTDHFVLAMFGLAFSGSMVMVGVQLYRNFAVNLLAQRAQAEQAATISLLLNEFENSASDWLWETDRDGGLVRAPERMLDILGSAVAGSIGWTLDAALTRPGCGGQSSIGRAMQSGTAFRDVIVQSVDVAGQDRWIAFTASPKAGGGYRGVGSDVTARITAERQAAAALRRAESAEQRLNDGIDSLGAGLVLCDGHDRIVIANKRLRLMFPVGALLGTGRTLDEVVYAQAALWLPQAPDLADAWASEFLAKRRNSAEAFDIRLPTGSWVRVEGRAMSDGGNVTTLTDITDIKQQEAMLASQSERLAASNSELQQFANIASHDLQEPLRKIEVFGARLAARSGAALDADGRHALERMTAATKRMRLLVSELLSYSRDAQHVIKKKPIDLDQVFANVTDDLSITIEERQATVTGTGLGVVDGDATQLRQLFQNLISNAMKFTKPGVASRITVERAAGPDRTVEIRFRDNGIGFDMKYHDQIFKIFQRLHGRETYEGTGIGLATCRKIAERHGGSIRAESTPGEGATFIITFQAPAAAGSAQAERAA